MPVGRSFVDFNCLPRHSFSNKTFGRYSGSQMFVIAGHKRRERERDAFFLKGNTRFHQSFIRASTIHCYLICFQIVIFLQLNICHRSLMHILRHMRLCRYLQNNLISRFLVVSILNWKSKFCFICLIWFFTSHQQSFSYIRGPSNKFWQWPHISETVLEIRILFPIACGHRCCLLMFEIWSFYHNLIRCYTNL